MARCRRCQTHWSALGTAEVAVDVVHRGVGAINESDVLLATTTSATIIGFHVRPDVKAATVGEDEHSVGLQEILDLKHGGIERYGFRCHSLGTSVTPERLLDAATEHGARVVLVSTMVTHHDVHKQNMRRLHELAVERGVRDELLLVSGGTQVSDELARECGMDAGFGRGTKGRDVAGFIVRRLRET